MTLTLETGKFYRTRDGYCAGPMQLPSTFEQGLGVTGTLAGYIKGTGVRVFKIDGGAHAYGESALDLVAEWKDEETAVPVAVFAWTGFGGLPQAAPKGTWFTDPSGKMRKAMEDLYKGQIPWLDPVDVGAFRSPPTRETSEADRLADARWPDGGSAEEARGAVFSIGPIPEWYTDSVHTTGEWLYVGDGREYNGRVFRNVAPAYRTKRTDNPPMLSVKDGTLIVSVTHEGLTLEAAVGDGRAFFAQVVELLVDPALLARQTTADFARAYMKLHGLGALND